MTGNARILWPALSRSFFSLIHQPFLHLSSFHVQVFRPTHPFIQPSINCYHDSIQVRSLRSPDTLHVVWFRCFPSPDPGPCLHLDGIFLLGVLEPRRVRTPYTRFICNCGHDWFFWFPVNDPFELCLSTMVGSDLNVSSIHVQIHGFRRLFSLLSFPSTQSSMGTPHKLWRNWKNDSHHTGPQRYDNI